MKHATATLEGALLDQAVALALGIEGTFRYCGVVYMDLKEFAPSTDWAHGGPLFDLLGISLQSPVGKAEWAATIKDENRCWLMENGDRRPCYIIHKGATPLVAAMRALVAAKLGDEVEL